MTSPGAKTSVEKPMDECWQKIGVWSKEKRCPVLREVIHCRNCEVFIQSGRRLLDQDLPDAYREEWAGIMSSEKEEEQFQTISLALFRVETEWLALRTQVLSEVIDPESLKRHTLPHRKNRILTGIINVRGEIQLCVSIRELLGIETSGGSGTSKAGSGKPADKTRYQRMMVIHGDDGKWVFPVSEIVGIHRIQTTAFRNVPVTVAKAQSTFTKGIFKWEGRYVAFLDDELLIYSLTRSVQ
jgi:chemotaxis-related protein WspD